jgi:hypothetical protein
MTASMKSENGKWKMEDGIGQPMSFAIFHPQSSNLV